MVYCVLCYQYDIFVNCNWVVTRWQQYSTHLHTNDTQNDTKQTIHSGVTESCPASVTFIHFGKVISERSSNADGEAR